MANTIITPTVIAKEALMQLENSLVMGKRVHRDYKKEFVKVGSTVSIRKPVKFVASTGATRVNQDVTEATTSIVIDQQKHVSWNFSSVDLTLSIAEYSERYIKPAMIALGNAVDSSLCDLYKDVFMAAGTAGTTPATFAALGAAGQKLDDGAVPRDSRSIVMNPAATWSMADALKTLNNPEMVEDFVRSAKLGKVAGFDLYMDQNIKSHVKGVATGTPLVNGASQVSTYPTATTSLATDGWTVSTTDIIKAGDIITLAGVNRVNPVSKVDTGVLQQFTVTANASSGATTGPATLIISPAIIVSGPYQTVTAAAADNAAIVVVANHAANLAFNKNAFALVVCPMELPDGATFKARESANGFSVRTIKDYDIDNDVDIIRIDILYGVKTIYADLACRLLG
jgi:hypothetical protein